MAFGGLGGLIGLSAAGAAPGAYQQYMKNRQQLDEGERQALAKTALGLGLQDYTNQAGDNALQIFNSGPQMDANRGPASLPSIPQVQSPGGQSGGGPGMPPGSQISGPQPPAPGAPSMPARPPQGMGGPGGMPGSPQPPDGQGWPRPQMQGYTPPGGGPGMPPNAVGTPMPNMGNPGNPGMGQQMAMRGMAPPPPQGQPPGMTGGIGPRPPMQPPGGGPMPPGMAPPGAGAGPPGAGGQPPMQGMGQQGQADWRQILQSIFRANPGIRPDVAAEAVTQAMPFMNMASKQEWLMAHNQFLQDQLRQRGAIAADNADLKERGQDIGLAKTQANIEARGSEGQKNRESRERIATMRQNGNPFAAAYNEDGTPKLSANAMDKALAIYQYREPPILPSRGGKMDPGGAAVMDIVRGIGNQSGEPYDATGYNARQRGEIAFTSGKQAQTIQSIGVAQDHLQTLVELGKALDGGDITVANRIANAWSKATGHPEVTNAQVAAQIIAAEVVKAVSAAGGGVKERLEAAGHIDPAGSPDQIVGAANTWSKLLDGQINGFKNAWARIPGNKDKDFDKQFGIQHREYSKEGPAKSGTAAPAGGGDNAAFIAKAKEAGYSDAEIQKFLKDRTPQAPKIGG